MVASSMYNPNLITMVDALMEAPMLMIEVPKALLFFAFGDRNQDMEHYMLYHMGKRV